MQSCGLFALGSLREIEQLAEVVVGAAEEVKVAAEEVEGMDEVVVEVMSGSLGSGQVMSSEQNYLILLKRYHCLVGASPDGVTLWEVSSSWIPVIL